MWPIMGPIMKRLRWIDLIFVVYPGTNADITAYTPAWFQRKFKNVFPLSVIGIVSRGKKGKRGLIVTLSRNPDELSPDQLKELLRRMRNFAEITKASSVALAGRLPSILLANHITLEPPFLTGERGSVFTVVETLQYVLATKDLSLHDTIGVLGVGFIGGKVLRYLRDLGYTSLIGFDPLVKNPHENNHMILTNDFTFLSRCQVVIVLTAKGSDVADAIPYLREGVIVVDDTHPQLPPLLVRRIREKKGEVYKSVLGLEGVCFLPEMPGYHRQWLPGCVIEALVVSNGYNGTNQEKFDQKGREIGLRPLLIKAKGDG